MKNIINGGPNPAAAQPAGKGHAFAALGISAELVRAVEQEGYVEPTPVQRDAVPAVLAGRDLLACAQTGTGKTAAFLLPILHRLRKRGRTGAIRALVLAPTRELAGQIAERAEAYGRHGDLRCALLYGGVAQRRQERDLERKPDLLVATPGRLLDLLQQRLLSLSAVEVFVLDEADRMLDMGFIHDVRRVIAALPAQRQTLLFSATVPAPIRELSARILRDPVQVAVSPKTTAAPSIRQSVYMVPRLDKRALLERTLRAADIERALVFTRTKHAANRVSDMLCKAGIQSAAIHGNKSQNARERALDGFRRGTMPVLVATDIAARGIDVEGVSHVINYDLPNVPETYVHRIGRTGRAGSQGTAISFCDPEEQALLRQIERLLKYPIRVEASSASPQRAAAPGRAADPDRSFKLRHRRSGRGSPESPAADAPRTSRRQGPDARRPPRPMR